MVEINLLDPHAIDDPHGYFRQFRDGGPIQWSDRHRAWIVMGHPELNAAFRDPRLSTERMSGFRERLSGPRSSRWLDALSRATRAHSTSWPSRSIIYSTFSERVGRSSATDRR